MKKTFLFIIIFPFLLFSEVSKDVIFDTGKSLLLPGYGFFGLDKKVNSIPFILSETILLPFFTYLTFDANRKGDDALNFASYILSKNVSEYPENLLTKMEFYTSYRDYNIKVISKARSLYPDDYEKQLDYINKNIVPDSLGWEFSSDSARVYYSDLRKSSRELKQFSYYTLIAISINHIVSGIYTYFVSKEIRNIDFDTQLDSKGIKFNFGVKF